MPICRECNGAGKVKVKTEIMARCPDCDGTKVLPDGSDCKRCDRWGEVGTGKYEVEEKLCKTCLGSGKVSEGSMTAWFLVRVIPTTLVVLGGEIAFIWALRVFRDIPLVTAIAIIVVFGLWGSIIYYFVADMPSLGEISTTNWFLIRAIPSTVTLFPIGAAAAWIVWLYLQSPPVTAIVVLAGFLVWGVIMFYFISHLPE